VPPPVDPRAASSRSADLRRVRFLLSLRECFSLGLWSFVAASSLPLCDACSRRRAFSELGKNLLARHVDTMRNAYRDHSYPSPSAGKCLGYSEQRHFGSPR